MTRILVVEGDDRDAKRIDGSLRGRPGWEVVRAATLLEAIRAAGDTRFDAAVLNTDLPDGSGLDILDFLRIGSPGIRIVLCAQNANESVAFHALSHGAGDFLVKDAHLEQELPGRIDALLDHPEPMAALVESLSPIERYDAPVSGPDRATLEASGLDRLLDEIVTGNVLAAGVWDLRGRPVSVRLPKDLDGDGVGFAAATIHGQIGALWTYGALKPTGYRMVVDVEGGILAVTAIPGTYLVALLFEGAFSPRRAIERVEHAGIRVLAALQGGSSGGDVAAP